MSVELQTERGRRCMAGETEATLRENKTSRDGDKANPFLFPRRTVLKPNVSGGQELCWRELRFLAFVPRARVLFQRDE